MWLNIYHCLLLAAVIIEVSSGQSPHGGTRQFFEGRGARSLERAKRSPMPIFGGVWPPIYGPWPRLTTPEPDNGCVLPEQPIGGRYELDQCMEPCSFVAGSIVPVGSILNYSCKEGFTLDGRNTVSCEVQNRWHTLPTCIECGTERSRAFPLVFNGFVARHGSFPWHVGIYETQTNGSRKQICGGSLISSKLVISAAHCFYDDSTATKMNANNFIVAAGKYYRPYGLWLDRFAQHSSVKKITLTKRYSGYSGNYVEDIALIRVWTPFNLTSFVRPVCIDWENTFAREHLQEGRVGKASGWGKTADGNPSLELQEISLPYVPLETCISAVPRDFRGYITYDKFCAGYTNGSSLCDGDSGGGLVFQNNNIWYLRGIVSLSPVMEGMCDNRYYNVFTNVGIFRDRIQRFF